MTASATVRYTAAIACIAIILGGCSGQSAPMLPAQRSQSSSAVAAAWSPAMRNASGPLLYISDFFGAFVDVFQRNGTRVGRITTDLNHPVGLFVDSSHNLWVANSGANDVLKFHRGSSTPSVYNGVTAAYAATKCPDGTLYVTNYSGKIAVFKRGHHSPTGSLSESYGLATSIACDSAGNVFVTATVLSPPGYVVEFPAGNTQATLLPISLPNPVDVKPDPAGNLLVLDSAGGAYNTVAEYTEAGYPTGKSMSTGANWAEMAMSLSGTHIFGADLSDLDGSLRTFPDGKQLQTYADSNFKQPSGIAYDPGK